MKEPRAYCRRRLGFLSILVGPNLLTVFPAPEGGPFYPFLLDEVDLAIAADTNFRTSLSIRSVKTKSNMKFGLL